LVRVLHDLSESADYIIIDSPPVLAVSDALILGLKVDAAVVTARLGSTTRDEAREASESLRRAGARTIGVVATGMKMRGGYYLRRGYYRYGY
jgi:Mrp family chromosome partitioning ATPase